MADEVIAQIFENKQYGYGKSEEFGYKFFSFDYLLNEKPFDGIAQGNQYYKLDYRVEGVADGIKSKFKITYNGQNYYYDEVDKIDLNLYHDISKFKLYVNDIYIDSPLQSGLYGEIIGNINIKECGITNPEDIEIVCLTNDSKRLIGRYDAINGTYKIPNLDANQYYDIILVDKSRKIEQQVLSYRKPTPY